MHRWHLAQAARAIANGGIIAYPTEAVFGLGCDPGNAAAVLQLLKLKQRRVEKGLILIAANLEQLLPYIQTPAPALLQRINSTGPAPITWLLTKQADCPVWLSGQHPTIAVRITRHPLAAALCLACNSALVSTSANRRGQTPARNTLRVRQQMGDALDYILNGATNRQAQPSEIRDGMTGRIIRHG